MTMVLPHNWHYKLLMTIRRASGLFSG